MLVAESPPESEPDSHSQSQPLPESGSKSKSERESQSPSACGKVRPTAQPPHLCKQVFSSVNGNAELIDRRIYVPCCPPPMQA
eukprot:360614-Chlamydomonas_euryale.AAC.4